MNSAGISLLTDPHPCHHIVYPYTDEEEAINAVYLFASSGLSKEESVVLIMTNSRCEPIEERLTSAGFNLAALRASGRLKCINADSMLRTFIKGGRLDEQLFKETASWVIDRARTSSLSGKVRLFGEMVSLLFARNETAVAERLEELWNEVIDENFVSLFCTYTLPGASGTTLPDSLARLHSHNLAPELVACAK